MSQAISYILSPPLSPSIAETSHLHLNSTSSPLVTGIELPLQVSWGTVHTVWQMVAKFLPTVHHHQTSSSFSREVGACSSPGLPQSHISKITLQPQTNEMIDELRPTDIIKIAMLQLHDKTNDTYDIVNLLI